MSGSSSGGRAPLKHMNKGLSFVLAGVAALMIVLTTGFFIWHKAPTIIDMTNLKSADTSALMEHWRNGDVVVMVRHAERCDRSDHPCLGPADGITRLGSDVSVQLGQAYQQIGLANTEVLTSPILRTAQTAQYMFNKEAVSGQWLADCGPTMRRDLIAHKQAGRNMILVTHSGCISDFEKQSGFKHAPTAEYNSSLFVLVTGDGKAKILGIANMPNWPVMTAAQR